MAIENEYVESNLIEPDEPTSVGPGQRLRLAREACHLSRTDVATRLHLSTHFIEAIEDDNYHKLPALSFARGYLRAYARILGLPAEEIIKSFEKSIPAGQAQELLPQTYHKRASSVSDRSVRWITIAIAFILITLVAMWWHNQNTLSSNAPVAHVTAATVSNTSLDDDSGHSLVLPHEDSQTDIHNILLPSAAANEEVDNGSASHKLNSSKMDAHTAKPAKAKQTSN